jgi:hypothetical protein
MKLNLFSVFNKKQQVKKGATTAPKNTAAPQNNGKRSTETKTRRDAAGSSEVRSSKARKPPEGTGAEPHTEPHNQELRIASCQYISDQMLDQALRPQYAPIDVQRITLYCAVQKVTIYCHSNILDKMGDLTKFVIRSVAEGKTIEDILLLTQMGSRTIDAEIQYLKKGKLLEDSDDLRLTALGRDYGRLVERFEKLAKGIPAQLNLYTNCIELCAARYYASEELSKDDFVIDGKISMVLLQNDNYSNSLEFVQPYVQEEIPFLEEITESLYTTIRVEKRASRLYQKLVLPDQNKELNPEEVPRREAENDIRFCLPVQKIHYRLRSGGLDEYRSVLDTLDKLDQYGNQLLSEKALLLVKRYREEIERAEYTVSVNTYNGALLPENAAEPTGEKPPDAAFVLGGHDFETPFALNPDFVNGQFYLEEVKRETMLFLIRVPYAAFIPEKQEEVN